MNSVKIFQEGHSVVMSIDGREVLSVEKSLLDFVPDLLVTSISEVIKLERERVISENTGPRRRMGPQVGR